MLVILLMVFVTSSIYASNFDNVALGKIPDTWKIDATNSFGSLPIWKVINDTTAPSGNHVLAMTNSNHASGNTFNICWTNKIHFFDGEIQVKFKAVSGKEDQGGGIIWRVQDEDNYYIARFNPLEDNFRLYYVDDGLRKTLASTQIVLDSNKWNLLKITQHENFFKAYINDKLLLKGSDDFLMKSGGVGVWTKADAVTSFDDFSVKLFKK